jgi:hypothetical protein
MTTLLQVKNDVTQYLSTIDEYFSGEFFDIDANQYTALINNSDELIGVGVSRKAALAHAEVNLGYEAITKLFINNRLTDVRLTQAGFEMLVDGYSIYDDFITAGDFLLSAHFVSSIKQAAGNIDALLKQVNADNSFTFKIRSHEPSENEPKVFVFEMNLDGDLFDGGFVKRVVVEEGAWLSVTPNLMSIKQCFMNHLAQQRRNKEKGVHL